MFSYFFLIRVTFGCLTGGLHHYFLENWHSQRRRYFWSLVTRNVYLAAQFATFLRVFIHDTTNSKVQNWYLFDTNILCKWFSNLVTCISGDICNESWAEDSFDFIYTVFSQLHNYNIITHNPKMAYSAKPKNICSTGASYISVEQCLEIRGKYFFCVTLVLVALLCILLILFYLFLYW